MILLQIILFLVLYTGMIAFAAGWVMAVFSVLLIIGAFMIGAWNGICNDFGFWQFFIRFIVMILLLKAFDILFFD